MPTLSKEKSNAIHALIASKILPEYANYTSAQKRMFTLKLENANEQINGKFAHFGLDTEAGYENLKNFVENDVGTKISAATLRSLTRVKSDKGKEPVKAIPETFQGITEEQRQKLKAASTLEKIMSVDMLSTELSHMPEENNSLERVKGGIHATERLSKAISSKNPLPVEDENTRRKRTPMEVRMSLIEPRNPKIKYLSPEEIANMEELQRRRDDYEEALKMRPDSNYSAEDVALIQKSAKDKLEKASRGFDTSRFSALQKQREEQLNVDKLRNENPELYQKLKEMDKGQINVSQEESDYEAQQRQEQMNDVRPQHEIAMANLENDLLHVRPDMESAGNIETQEAINTQYAAGLVPQALPQVVLPQGIVSTTDTGTSTQLPPIPQSAPVSTGAPVLMNQFIRPLPTGYLSAAGTGQIGKTEMTQIADNVQTLVNIDYNTPAGRQYLNQKMQEIEQMQKIIANQQAEYKKGLAGSDPRAEAIIAARKNLGLPITQVQTKAQFYRGQGFNPSNANYSQF